LKLPGYEKKGTPTMKAQVSLEYMILALVALAVLSISIFALLKIKDNAADSQRLVMLKHDSEAIFAAEEEICAGGNGNSRNIGLSGNEPLHFDYTGRTMRFSYGNGNAGVTARLSLSKNATCDGSIEEWILSKITMENEKGKIIIR
jgi:hypothetical protein